MAFYQHWRKVPKQAWLWPSFSPAEIACRGTGKILINEDALNKLQDLRTTLGKPMIVHSAYRSPEHNTAVGGAKPKDRATEATTDGGADRAEK